jgi:hypothetical protein
MAELIPKFNQGEKFYKIVFIRFVGTRGCKLVSIERPDKNIVFKANFGRFNPKTNSIDHIDRTAIQDTGMNKTEFEALLEKMRNTLPAKGMLRFEIQDYSVYPTYLDQVESMIENGTFNITTPNRLTKDQQKELLRAWVAAQKGQSEQLNRLSKKYDHLIDSPAGVELKLN